MMSLVGIWAPREAVWGSLLCGGDPFEHLALERRNFYGERSRNLGCDLSGHWPPAPSSDGERELAAAAVAKRIELVFEDWVDDQSTDPRNGKGSVRNKAMAEAKLAGAVAAMSAAPAHLLPHSIEVLVQQLLSHTACPHTSRAIRLWLWASGLRALQLASSGGSGGSEGLSLRMQAEAAQTFFMGKGNVKVDGPQGQGLLRSAARRIELMEALMLERGALQHYLSRALSQRLFGDLGYLGTPLLQETDDIWGVGGVMASYANTLPALNSPPEPGVLFAAAGQRPLIYAAARWLQEVRKGMVLVPDAVVFGGAPAGGGKSAGLRAAYAEAKQLEQLGLEGDNDATVRRTLLPVVTEDILLAVVSTVWRYSAAITPDSLPANVVNRAVWQFLHLLGDHRYSGEEDALVDPAPPLAFLEDWRGIDYYARCERGWDDDALSTIAVDAMEDWRVDEILMPLLAAVVAAHLRSQGHLASGESMQALMPVHEHLGLGDNTIHCRPFLQACGQLWKQRDKGLAPHVIAEQMGVEEDALREWLKAQPFQLTTIEELLINLSNTGEELTFALAGGLLDSQQVRGHCIPGWLQRELDVITEHQRLKAAGLVGAAAPAAPPAEPPAKQPKRRGRPPKKGGAQ